VAFDLGNADGGVGSLRRVVVVLLVFERLSKRGGSVKAYDAEFAEIGDSVEPGHAKEVEAGLGGADRLRLLQAAAELGGCSGDHAAQGDVAVAEFLEFLDRVGVGRGTPALGDPDRRE